MTDLIEVLKGKGITLPENVSTLLKEAKSVSFFNTTEELLMQQQTAKKI